MPRDLFGDVTRPSISVGNRKWYTVPVSLFSHAAAVALIIALPLLAPGILPLVLADNELRLITIVPPSPPPLPPERTRQPVTDQPANDPAIPIEAPAGISAERPRDEPRWEDRSPIGVIGGDVDSRVLQPPPPASKVDPPAPVRVGGAIRQPQKRHEVNPIYPPIAQSARVQGIVIIEATIGEDGRVMNARILRSVPLLDQAALDAVRQWEYTPTMLNGVPVPVVMTVTVSFMLSR